MRLSFRLLSKTLSNLMLAPFVTSPSVDFVDLQVPEVERAKQKDLFMEFSHILIGWRHELWPNKCCMTWDP